MSRLKSMVCDEEFLAAARDVATAANQIDPNKTNLLLIIVCPKNAES
jgi:hypothetical protein